jgi:hypothetical protein
MPTLTFFSDPKVKDLLLARIGAHEEIDAIQKGSYEKWNGQPARCAVGCSVRDLSEREGVPSDWHAEYERILGIPIWFAKLEDQVFEHLPDELAKSWPRRFSEAVPVGVNLDGLADRLAVRRLREECLPLSGAWPESVRAQVVAAIEQVIAALEPKRDESAARSAARSAESAARAAWSAESAARAAWSAARSAESAAAWSAAWSAESAARAAWSAESAAWSAESAAWSAARSAESAAYEREASRIIEELGNIERSSV